MVAGGAVAGVEGAAAGGVGTFGASVAIIVLISLLRGSLSESRVFAEQGGNDYTTKNSGELVSDEAATSQFKCKFAN